VAKHPGFPFAPKSTAHVRAGDFWAIPLRRGGWYACGRVLRVWDSRVNLTVGLLDWCEPVLPTPDNIAGARVLRYSMIHIKSGRLTGGELLGHRPLVQDGGWESLVGEPDLGPGVHEGAWGYLFIEELAHGHFGRHFPESPNPAVERPVPLQQGLF
jgi:hypothetical protein